jgi:hypothetical protein
MGSAGPSHNGSQRSEHVGNRNVATITGPERASHRALHKRKMTCNRLNDAQCKGIHVRPAVDHLSSSLLR